MRDEQVFIAKKMSVMVVLWLSQQETVLDLWSMEQGDLAALVLLVPQVFETHSIRAAMLLCQISVP